VRYAVDELAFAIGALGGKADAEKTGAEKTGVGCL
jgi:hypothetical protein